MITLDHLATIFVTGEDYRTKIYTYRRFMNSKGYCVRRLRNCYFGTTNELKDREWETVAVKDEIGIMIKR